MSQHGEYVDPLLVRAILDLAHAIRGSKCGNETQSILNRIEELENKIMSAISDFAAKQNAFNDRMDTAIADLQGDVKNLNDQIAALQTSTGAITPEDQAALDALQARASTIADKLDALDALTPPVAPVPPTP